MSYPVSFVSPSPAYPAQADPRLKTTKLLPTAGAGNNHDTIDLGQPLLFPDNERIALEVSVPDLPSLADAKTATFTVKDSPDDVTYTAIPEVAAIVLTGAGGVGAAAVTRRF